ncbi:hypothetical protein [Paraburkholderia acidisoli]|uniref:Uncharacterized protein n=1 Tax=Paraburkholderia acidisoli TaxID=2571748 RepID=A0A7Z2GIE4_9BURK|nr:hypothetical protein [Paraburkholderia acidisoli]QGZ62020.1 hypothetical protein FAZ98_09920 [Paraburkholderia acidisoli]
MSTIPFVQVEGVLALPHIRPLARLPASFGREWALTVPHFSLRTELRALYAAIMRTVCLSAETFRSIYRWDHLRSPAPAAAAAEPVARIPVSAPVGQDSRSTTQTSASAAKGRGAMPARTPPADRHKLTGGAVAIGGAAMLAWIIASHAPHNTAPVDHAAAPNAQNDSAHRLADARAQHEQAIARPAGEPQAATPVASRERTAPGEDNTVTAGVAASPAGTEVAPGTAQVAASAPPAAGPATASARVAAPVATHTIAITPNSHATPATPVAVATIAVPANPAAPAIGETAALNAAPTATTSPVAVAPVAKVAAAPARAQPDFSVRTPAKTAVPATLITRSESRGERMLKPAQERRATQSKVSARHAGTRGAVHDARAFAPYRDTAPVTTQRSRGTYSAAQPYSPRQTNVNPADEYASLVTYANTHTASPAVNRATVAPVAADNTDWVNHVSQRRVTEVPDRFAK